MMSHFLGRRLYVKSQVGRRSDDPCRWDALLPFVEADKHCVNVVSEDVGRHMPTPFVLPDGTGLDEELRQKIQVIKAGRAGQGKGKR